MIGSPGRLEIGPLIARGLTSEIFAVGVDRVLKLFFDWFRREKITREFAVTKAIQDAGLPVPNAFEFVEVDGRLGIVYERLDGISMMREAARKPWSVNAATRRFAELHAQMHECHAPAELPTQRKLIEGWIADAKDLSDSQRAAARDAAESLANGDAVCHGDFHPENVLLTGKGPAIIDWTNGTRGNPIGDVSRTARLITSAEIPEDWPLHIRVLIAASRQILVKIYLQRYFELRPGRPSDIRAWDAIERAAMSAWRARKDC